jgi:hypothetical protein
MVSSTRQSERRRNIRSGNAGRSRKGAEARASTPKFPIHPVGYDPTAPDAKRSPSAAKKAG